MPTKKAALQGVAKAPETKTGTITFRVRPSLKEALDRAAADDRRSVSSIVEILLEEALRARGYLE